MPTYEYQCNACGHRFDELQSFSDAHLKKCPKCKKNKLQRLIGTGAAILFKGSGFYQTDYRSDSYKSAASADKPKETTEKTGTSTATTNTGTKDTSGTSNAAEAKPAPKKAKS